MFTAFSALAAMLIAAPLLAALDGFSVNSSTFTTQYDGNEIWDGTDFLNDWAAAGGATAANLSLSGSDLSLINTADNGWLHQDTATSAWDLGSGSYTIELSAKLNNTTAANDNFNIWASNSGTRTNLTITATGVAAGISPVDDLLTGVDNTDDFHTFRIAYDATANQSFVWRDDVELTSVLGSVGDTNSRLIIGDCCTSLGNPTDPFELRYVRYDFTGAYSPVADQGSVTLTVNRATGEVLIDNTSSTGVENIIGYSITSDAGSLDAGPWDKFSTFSPLSGDNDTWTTLTPAGGVELAEAVLDTPGDGDGGNIDALSSFSFGNVWKQTPLQDLAMEVLLDDGSILTTAAGDFAIEYTGDAIVAGDLAGATVNDGPDGDIDVVDWLKFRASVGNDLAGSLPADAYLGGDLTGDLVVNHVDFNAFVAAFDAANGAGAFATLVRVPEPSTGLLLLAGLGLACGARSRKRHSAARQPITTTIDRTSERGIMNKASMGSALLGVALVLGLGSVAQAQVLDSSTFANQYNGSDIYLDGAPPGTGAGAFSADWSQAGGADVVATDLTNNGTSLVYTPTSNNGWLQQDGEASPWEAEGTGVVSQLGWTFELSVDLNDISGANDNIVMWNEGGGNRQIIVIAAGEVRTFGGTVLDTNDNTDGQHVFQLQYDSTDTTADPSGTYQLYRDGVQIGTDLARESGQGLSRLIVGDCCTSLGNPIDQYEIGHVRFDTVLPTPDNTLTLEVDTITGAVSLVNNSSVSVDFNGYFIESASGQLSTGGWSSLQEHPSFGNGNDDDGVGWESFDTQTTGFLGEGNLSDGLGNAGFSTLASGASVSLGAAYNPAIAGSGIDGDLLFTLTDQNGRSISSDIFGTVEYVTGLAVDGDYSGNGIVDAIDYAIWRESLGQTGAGLAADGNGDNVVNTADYDYWKVRFGNTSGSGAATATPEPAAGLLALVAALGLGGLSRARRQKVDSISPAMGSQGGDAMRTIKPLAVTLLALAVAAAASPALADVTNDRSYLFGDDSFENGTPGGVLGVDFSGTRLTFDSEVSDTVSPLSDAQDLTATGGTYIAVDGTDGGGLPARPGAANGSVGANLDGDDSLLSAISFNSPNEYWDSPDLLAFIAPETYPRNYDGIFSRGIEFWAYADSANDDGGQHVLVRDSDEHGVVITSSGTWGNAFDNAIRDSGVAVAFDQWSHVQVVSRNGAAGSILYINGVAVEANTPFYDPQRAVPLVVGSNFAADGEFFTGVIDDMNLFLWGDNEMGSPGTLTDGEDWGTFSLAEDNEVVAQFLSDAGVTNEADVNLDGSITAADASAFVGFYGFEQLVSGLVVGDLVSRQNGDLNYDGRTDLRDAFILHEALDAAGIPISIGDLIGGAVPEPASAALMLLASIGLLGSMRKTR